MNREKIATEFQHWLCSHNVIMMQRIKDFADKVSQYAEESCNLWQETTDNLAKEI